MEILEKCGFRRIVFSFLAGRGEESVVLRFRSGDAESGGGVKMVGSRAAEPSVVDLESVSEYKRGLYDKLHSTGILDNLKSHLRARILSKLSGQDKVSLAAQRGAHEGGHDGIISRVLDTLFTDYLRHNGFDYTLSVFLPESGLQSPSSALSLQEVLRMLHVDETSQMGRAIRDRASAASGDAGQSNTAGCLSTLILGSLAHVNSSKPLHEAETQTWDLAGGVEGGQSVALEVQRIEHRLQGRLESERASLKAVFETRLSDYRRDVELKSRADVQAQVERVREIETRSIRIQESAKAWESLAKEKEELERAHSERLAQLKASELETMQRVGEAWRQAEEREEESRRERERQRKEHDRERERFEDEVAERRAGLERREKAVDERTNAAQVKQIEAEKLLDFAAQQLEQARLLKVRTLDVSGGSHGGQPASAEVAAETLQASRKEAADLRRRIVERTRENEQLRERARDLEREAEGLVPREAVEAERASWREEREALMRREQAWQSALRRANAAVEESSAAHEEALAQLEEARSRAAMAAREAADLRAHARELQLAFDSSFYRHRGRLSAPVEPKMTSLAAAGTADAGSAVDLAELERLERGFDTRLESFKSRGWATAASMPEARPPAPKAVSLPHPAAAVPRPATAPAIPAPGSPEPPERDYVGEAMAAAERVAVEPPPLELPSSISSALGLALGRPAAADLGAQGLPEAVRSAADIPRESPRRSPSPESASPSSTQSSTPPPPAEPCTDSSDSWAGPPETQKAASPAPEPGTTGDTAKKAAALDLATPDPIEVSAIGSPPSPVRVESPVGVPALGPASSPVRAESPIEAARDPEPLSPAPSATAASPAKPMDREPEPEPQSQEDAEPEPTLEQQEWEPEPETELEPQSQLEGSEPEPQPEHHVEDSESTPGQRPEAEEVEEEAVVVEQASVEEPAAPSPAAAVRVTPASSPLNPAARPFTPKEERSSERPRQEQEQETTYTPSWSPKKATPSAATPSPDPKASPAAKAAAKAAAVETVSGVSPASPGRFEAWGGPPRSAADPQSPSLEESVTSPVVAPFRSPDPEPRDPSPPPRLTVADILTRAKEEEEEEQDRSESELAEEVDSDINSDGSASPMAHGGGETAFGMAAGPGLMGQLPTEAPEGSPLGPPIAEASDLSDINYSELDEIRDFDDDEDVTGAGAAPFGSGSKEELSVASFTAEGSGLSIPGLSSEESAKSSSEGVF